MRRPIGSRVGRVAYGTLIALLYAFLLLPVAIVVIASFNAGNYLRFPPQGFSLRWFRHFAETASFTRSSSSSFPTSIFSISA